MPTDDMCVSPASPITSLPQELIDRILDEFGSLPIDQDARRTLLSCALVCRLFRSRAQHLLVKDIQITNGSPKVLALYATLRSTPGLSQHIKSLRLGFDRDTAVARDVADVLNFIKVHGIGLQRLGVCFAAHYVLPLGGMVIRFIQQSLSQSLSHLGTLDLKSLSVPVTLLAQCSNLKTLIIEHCLFHQSAENDTPVEDVPRSTAFLPMLEALHITRCVTSFTEVFDDSRRGGSLQVSRFHNLKSLYCLFVNPSEVSRVWTLLRSLPAGTKLEKLEVVEEAMFSGFSPTDPQSFDLSKLKKLRHLKLKSVMANAHGRFDSTLARILNSYAVRGCTTIETLEIAIDTPFLGHPPDASGQQFFSADPSNGYDWKILDIDLSNPLLYPSLSTVKFLLHYRFPSFNRQTPENAQPHVRRALPSQFPILTSLLSVAGSLDVTLGALFDV